MRFEDVIRKAREIRYQRHAPYSLFSQDRPRCRLNCATSALHRVTKSHQKCQRDRPRAADERYSAKLGEHIALTGNAPEKDSQPITASKARNEAGTKYRVKARNQ